jgi:hypothetical protein
MNWRPDLIQFTGETYISAPGELQRGLLSAKIDWPASMHQDSRLSGQIAQSLLTASSFKV